MRKSTLGKALMMFGLVALVLGFSTSGGAACAG